jgi:hypothetical protein
LQNQNNRYIFVSTKTIKDMTTYKTANLEIQKVKTITITIQNTDWGWFVEVSDGYTSDYFKSKKEAIARRSEIKKEIKNKTW